LKTKIYNLKQEIENNLHHFSKEDLILVKPILNLLELMIESDASNEIINQYLIRLQYPIEIIEERINKFKKHLPN
jgi:hypothetical protein